MATVCVFPTKTALKPNELVVHEHWFLNEFIPKSGQLQQAKNTSQKAQTPKNKIAKDKIAQRPLVIIEKTHKNWKLLLQRIAIAWHTTSFFSLSEKGNDVTEPNQPSSSRKYQVFLGCVLPYANCPLPRSHTTPSKQALGSSIKMYTGGGGVKFGGLIFFRQKIRTKFGSIFYPSFFKRWVEFPHVLKAYLTLREKNSALCAE